MNDDSKLYVRASTFLVFVVLVLVLLSKRDQDEAELAGYKMPDNAPILGATE
jgi:hypothetical protein